MYIIDIVDVWPVNEPLFEMVEVQRQPDSLRSLLLEL